MEKFDAIIMKLGGIYVVKYSSTIYHSTLSVTQEVLEKGSVLVDAPFKYPEDPEVNIINDAESNPTTVATNFPTTFFLKSLQ